MAIYTRDDVLKSIELRRKELTREQELVTRERELVQKNTRELYKDERDKKKERHDRPKDSCVSTRVSGETQPLASSSTPVGISTTPSASFADATSFDKESCSSSVGGSEGVESARQPEKTFCGISAQHAITKSGIKLFLNMQTPGDVDNGSIISVTAELKQYSRLYEIKDYEFDTPEFTQLVNQLRENIRKTKPENGVTKQQMCMGRIHERGKRKEWLANMIVVGVLNTDGVLLYAQFYYNHECYDINMDDALTDKQQSMFHSSGHIGNIAKRKRPPTVAELPRTKL